MSVKKELCIVSITPDLALDVGYTYAGGLGVLEGDKFYAAEKLGGYNSSDKTSWIIERRFHRSLGT